VPDGGEGLAGVNIMVCVVFSLWGEGPAADGGVVKVE